MNTRGSHPRAVAGSSHDPAPHLLHVLKLRHGGVLEQTNWPWEAAARDLYILTRIQSTLR